MLQLVAGAAFLLVAIVVWRRGPGAGIIAYGFAALTALVAAIIRIVTGYYGTGHDWRVEASYIGFALTIAFAILGFLRD